MTRAKISQYSATANDNTDVNGVNIAEGCPPSSMNNMGREIMAALKRFQVGSDGDGVTVGGSLVVSGSTTVNTFNVDVISEKTSAAGVTVDSVLLKDGLVGIGADGSASAPSIYRASDTNTGIFFPAADTIAFAEGGAEAMRIDSSGNVGIGTTSVTGVLNMSRSTGTVANNAFVISNTNTGGTGGEIQWFSRTNDGTNTDKKAAVITVTNSLDWGSAAGVSSYMAFSTINANTLAERARITSGGDFLLANTNPNETTSVGVRLISSGAIRSTRSESTNVASTMDVYSTGASAYRFYVDMAGTVFATNTSISGISDVRYKENIRDLDVGLAEVMQLQPRVFDWKEGKGKSTQNDRGFIAQEFEQVFPDLIDEWKDPAPEGEEPYKSVRQDLIPVLVKSIQELKAINDAQASRIETLEAKVAALENA